MGGAAIPRQAQRRRGITACATASCLVPEDYVRHIEYKGQEVALESENRGLPLRADPMHWHRENRPRIRLTFKRHLTGHKLEK